MHQLVLNQSYSIYPFRCISRNTAHRDQPCVSSSLEQTKTESCCTLFRFHSGSAAWFLTTTLNETHNTHSVSRMRCLHSERSNSTASPPKLLFGCTTSGLKLQKHSHKNVHRLSVHTQLFLSFSSACMALLCSPGSAAQL